MNISALRMFGTGGDGDRDGDGSGGQGRDPLCSGDVGR